MRTSKRHMLFIAILICACFLLSFNAFAISSSDSGYFYGTYVPTSERDWRTVDCSNTSDKSCQASAQPIKLQATASNYNPACYYISVGNGKSLFIPARTAAEYNSFLNWANSSNVKNHVLTFDACTDHGTWGAFSQCSNTCGTGTQRRTCNYSGPFHGNDCSALDGGQDWQSCSDYSTCTYTPTYNGSCPTQCGISAFSTVEPDTCMRSDGTSVATTFCPNLSCGVTSVCPPTVEDCYTGGMTGFCSQIKNNCSANFGDSMDADVKTHFGFVPQAATDIKTLLSAACPITSYRPWMSRDVAKGTSTGRCTIAEDDGSQNFIHAWDYRICASIGTWTPGSCSVTCGGGTVNAPTCSTGSCDPATKPASGGACNQQACYTGTWLAGACNKSSGACGTNGSTLIQTCSVAGTCDPATKPSVPCTLTVLEYKGVGCGACPFGFTDYHPNARHWRICNNLSDLVGTGPGGECADNYENVLVFQSDSWKGNYTCPNYTGTWTAGSCSATCGGGTVNAPTCSTGSCDPATKPASGGACNQQACYTGTWLAGACNKSSGACGTNGSTLIQTCSVAGTCDPATKPSVPCTLITRHYRGYGCNSCPFGHSNPGPFAPFGGSSCLGLVAPPFSSLLCYSREPPSSLNVAENWEGDYTCP